MLIPVSISSCCVISVYKNGQLQSWGLGWEDEVLRAFVFCDAGVIIVAQTPYDIVDVRICLLFSLMVCSPITFIIGRIFNSRWASVVRTLQDALAMILRTFIYTIWRLRKRDKAAKPHTGPAYVKIAL